ncbi:MAG: tetratricopeptide repeat protein [Ignavibacteriae bacterium]|nr:MAG: tetratricopeptide repeat protein [Ignavibacteriota bacterium]
MAIQSKFRTEAERKSTKDTDHFTDREFYKEQFRVAFENNQNDIHNLLVYYGVGGIGKSALRKEIQKIISEEFKSVIFQSIDFDLSVYRQEETALYYLRKNFKDSAKISFPTFDIAYAVYWQKIHPNTPLTKESLSLLEDSSIVMSLISTLGQIPLVGLIPGITKTIIKSTKKLQEWWTKRGQKDLYNLPQLEAKDILVRLPMFFASDLKEHIRENNSRCVILFDTYEALWENVKSESSFFLFDEWIRELVSELPEPLWIFFGRERLRWSELDMEWEQYIKQHLIGGLTETDSKQLLCSYNIINENIQNIIAKASEGVPYYLDLAVDQYNQIKNNLKKEPEESDFAVTQNDVLSRFLKYLDKNEIETLKVLSVARKWNAEIFALLIDRFQTGYPVTALNELARFSFIQFNEQKNSYRINTLMAEGLKTKMEDQIKTQIHKCLFKYYKEILEKLDTKNITAEASSALNEAFYHGKRVFGIAEFTEWFYKIFHNFSEAGKWRELTPLMEDLSEIIFQQKGNDSLLYAESLNKTAALLIQLFQLDRAENMLQTALEIYEKTGNSNELGVSSVTTNLAKLFKESGKYEEAIKLYNKNIDLFRSLGLSDNEKYAELLDNLGSVLRDSGRYNDAIETHEKALELKKRIFGEKHQECARTVNNKAITYAIMNDKKMAKRMFEEALSITEKVYNSKHPLYAAIITNLGSIYFDEGQYEKALEFGKLALEIKAEIYGENHTVYGTSLGNIGSAYQRIGEYEKSLECHKREMEIFKKLCGTSHYNYLFSISNIAVVYISLKQYYNCLSVCKEIREIGIDIRDFNKELYALIFSCEIKAYQETGEYENAITACEDYIELMTDKTVETSVIPYLETCNDIINIYEQTGKAKEAEDLRRKISDNNL